MSKSVSVQELLHLPGWTHPMSEISETVKPGSPVRTISICVMSSSAPTVRMNTYVPSSFSFTLVGSCKVKQNKGKFPASEKDGIRYNTVVYYEPCNKYHTPFPSVVYFRTASIVLLLFKIMLAAKR